MVIFIVEKNTPKKCYLVLKHLEMYASNVIVNDFQTFVLCIERKTFLTATFKDGGNQLSFKCFKFSHGIVHIELVYILI